MQVSADKSRFCQESVEYLGFQLHRTGYTPLPSRVSAILRINPPENLKQIRAFLGVINFIKNHIPRRAEICKPITQLTCKDVKFTWGEEQKRAFDKVKAVISEAIMLEYPNPNRPFDLYPDASSTYAMGAVLEQDGKIVSTFSRKLNDAQLKYTVTGQELLAAGRSVQAFFSNNSGMRDPDSHRSSKFDTRRHATCKSPRDESTYFSRLRICTNVHPH
jgi:hypothetical protein